MRTVHEISKISGVSIRTLHYYDSIGLLSPTETTQSGYRLYDDTALARLQQILLFRELEFPLSEIKAILDSPNYDRQKAIEFQIGLLKLKRERLDKIISFAHSIKMIGVNNMDFSAFDKQKSEEYAKRAKMQWGETPAYKEFETKTKERTENDAQRINTEFMAIFAKLGALKDFPPEDEHVQDCITELQQYITDNYYTCTNEILAGLGEMYGADNEFTENIDKVGGDGTAQFVMQAIRTRFSKES